MLTKPFACNNNIDSTISSPILSIDVCVTSSNYHEIGSLCSGKNMKWGIKKTCSNFFSLDYRWEVCHKSMVEKTVTSKAWAIQTICTNSLDNLN